MTIQQSHPFLFKILSNWRNEPERPPLLLNGVKEAEWEKLCEEIINIFINEPVMASHPDILILSRDPKKQNIEVKQTRDFIGQLSLTSYNLPFKLGLIPSAHHLNVQSQNALLKTLEEPLSKRYLIMGTVSKNKLLPTILSRSTIINLSRVGAGFKPSPTLNGEIIGFYEDCLKSSLEKRLQKSQIWSEGKTDKIKEFFEAIIPEIHLSLTDSLKNKNFKTAQNLSRQLKKALDYSEQLGRTSGANPKMLFETFLLNIK